MESVRLLLALGVAKDWPVRHLDVNSTFLSSDLAETVFVKQPPGSSSKAQSARSHAYTRRDTGYGKRHGPGTQARRHHGGAWVLAVRHEACPVHLMTGKEHLIVGVYVDDLIVTGAQAVDIARFKEEMAACFRMSDLGVLSYYLDIEVRQGEDAIKLRQRAYALKLLERACMAGCKPVATPMESTSSSPRKALQRRWTPLSTAALSAGCVGSHTAPGHRLHGVVREPFHGGPKGGPLGSGQAAAAVCPGLSGVGHRLPQAWRRPAFGVQ